MKKNIAFRSWYYFRQGWSTYFAFIFAAVNTLTVTYYLAIENIPLLKEIFPTFILYVITLVSIGIPILVLVGYVHFKKSSAYKAEADITIESHPHFKRMMRSIEFSIPLHLQLADILIKLTNDEKLSDEQLSRLSEIKQKLKDHMDTSFDLK